MYGCEDGEQGVCVVGRRKDRSGDEILQVRFGNLPVGEDPGIKQPAGLQGGFEASVLPFVYGRTEVDQLVERRSRPSGTVRRAVVCERW